MPNKAECLAAGVDFREAAKLEKVLLKAHRMASKLGVTIFGGSGSGSLRKHPENGGTFGDSYRYRAYILIQLPCGGFDGGDGGTDLDADGLLRGE